MKESENAHPAQTFDSDSHSKPELVESTDSQEQSRTVITTPNTEETFILSGSQSASGQKSGAPKRARSENYNEEIDLCGQVISGKYKVEEKLGEGGMGSVYQAYDTLMKRSVAIKLLHQDRNISNETWMRFQQEAQATSTLDHPGIVRIHDFNISEEHGPYLVMDLIDGVPLSLLIARRSVLPPMYVAEIISQVADALEHAHQKGIVHRDLKPSNILIVNDGAATPHARVVDFGIAKLQNENSEDLKLTKTGEVFGSPLYMSPEQCLGQEIDARSDIYSLGCVMYESLSGQPPFKGKNFAETVIKHTQEAAKPLPAQLKTPSPLKKIMMCALEKKPENRYQSMKDLKKEVTAFSEGKRVNVKQKARFWIWALSISLLTIPIMSFVNLRKVIAQQPDKAATILLSWHLPKIVEWALLPNDQAGTVLDGVRLAMASYKNKEYPQAELMLQGIRNTNPTYANLTTWPLARAMAQQGKYKDAEALLKKDSAIHGDNAGENKLEFGKSMFITGVTLESHDGKPELGEFFIDGADKIFKELNETSNPSYSKVAYYLGRRAAREKNFKLARERFEQALKIQSSNKKQDRNFIERVNKSMSELP